MGGQAKQKELPLGVFGFSTGSVRGFNMFLFTCGCGFLKCFNCEQERRATLDVGRYVRHKATLWAPCSAGMDWEGCSRAQTHMVKVKVIGLRTRCLMGTVRVGVHPNFVRLEACLIFKGKQYRNVHIKLNSELWKDSMGL